MSHGKNKPEQHPPETTAPEPAASPVAAELASRCVAKVRAAFPASRVQVEHEGGLVVATFGDQTMTLQFSDRDSDATEEMQTQLLLESLVKGVVS